MKSTERRKSIDRRMDLLVPIKSVEMKDLINNKKDEKPEKQNNTDFVDTKLIV